MDAVCYKGSCRQPGLLGLKNLVAFGLEFLVFSKFHMIFFA